VDNLFQIEFATTQTNIENLDEEIQYGFEANKRLTCVIDNQGNPIDHLIDGIRVSLNGSLEKYSESLQRNAIYNKTIQISKLPNYLVI